MLTSKRLLENRIALIDDSSRVSKWFQYGRFQPETGAAIRVLRSLHTNQEKGKKGT